MSRDERERLFDEIIDEMTMEHGAAHEEDPGEDAPDEFYVDVLEVLRVALERGLTPIHADAERLRTKHYYSSAPPETPRILTQFVSAALAGWKAVRMLDPRAGIGSFLDPVGASVDTPEAIGVIGNSAFFDDQHMAEFLSRCPSARWLKGNPLEVLDELEGSFDAVVSRPPFGNYSDERDVGEGRAKKQMTLSYAGHQVTIRDQESHLTILKACTLLAEGGAAFCVVPGGFFIDDARDNVRWMLKEFGLYLDAVFALPPMATWYSTGTSAHLVVIRRIEHGELFVGELRLDMDIDPLLVNWGKRQEGRFLSLGGLVEADSFTTFRQLEGERYAKSLAQRAQLELRPVGTVAKEICLARDATEGAFPYRPNAIYFPVVGVSDVVTRKEDMSPDREKYVQIVLDSAKLDAAYAAAFFNNKMGRGIREALMCGDLGDRVFRASLRKALVAAPALDHQCEQVEVLNTITDLRSQLSRIEGKLWEEPQNVERIRSDLQHLGQQNQARSDEWIQGLPFPVASILYRYRATREPKRQEESLLHFFEALSEFLVMIFLSAANNDEPFFDKCREALTPQKDGRDVDVLKAGTFGGWCVLGGRLAKATRKLLSTPKTREQCLRMFRRRTSAFIEKITDKRLYAVLRETCEHRNEWRGHGGVEGIEEAQRRTGILESKVTTVRNVVVDGFDDARLVRPRSATYSEGVHANEVWSLTGSQTPFREETLQTTIPLDTKKLYLAEGDERDPLELVPLVRIMKRQETGENACYFYNRMQKDGVRWVSYHFEPEPERVSAVTEDAALVAFLSSLTERGV